MSNAKTSNLVLIRSRWTSKKALTVLISQVLSIYLVFRRWFLEEALKCGVRFSPDEIMTDFEFALVQSLELEFPGARIHGCYFHFSQCLWRKVQILGLVEEYKENTANRRFIQKSAAIAFNPLNFVRVNIATMYISLI